MRKSVVLLALPLLVACSSESGTDGAATTPSPDASPDTCQPSEEVCDGVDNDCNGLVDEGLQRVFYRDGDGDGYGDALGQEPVIDCKKPDGFVENQGDCDDSDSAVHPGATETCDGVDNDCNGLVDDGLDSTVQYPDKDSDGVGSWQSGPPIMSCNSEKGYAPSGDDCDDSDPAVHPGATETCDGVDNDCNGLIDDGIPTDGDGCQTPPAPVASAVVNTVTIVTRTWDGKNAGTDNNELQACVDSKHCYRLDVRAIDDNREGEIDVYHFENQNIPRSDIDRMEIRSLDGPDAWAVDCVELHLDGKLVHCWEGPHKWIGTDSTDVHDWNEPLSMSCTTCYPKPLTHGPMVGAVTSDSARILYRTHATVPTAVYVGSMSDGSDATAVAHLYPSVFRDYTAEAFIKGLKPSHVYYYHVEAEGVKSDTFSFKTAPAPASSNVTRFAFGSGVLRPDQSIFDRIDANKPDFFLFIGDNNYAWRGSTVAHDDDDVATLRWHYRWQWKRPWKEKMLQHTPTLAVWDDHDFVGNDSFGDWPGANAALRVFKEYWANPSYGTEDTPGIFFKWSWGDIDLFMLDDRFYRRDVSAPGEPADPGAMLGDAQTRWLQDGLLASKAIFKFIVSGSQFTQDSHRDSWAHYPAETRALYDFIRDAKISGVVLLDGDVHRSEIRMIERASQGGYDLPEFTSSGLSSGPGTCHTGESEVVTCYDDGFSFVQVEVSTTDADPFVTAKIIDSQGNEVGSHAVRLSELKL